MNDYILIADIHLGLYQSSSDWHKITINLFKDIYDVGIKRNIDRIIILGDFFHERKSINVLTLDVAQYIEDMLQDFNVWIIAGNHDIFYKDQIKPNALQIFRNSKNIKVIDYIEIMDNMTLVPWGIIPEKATTKYCLTHSEFNGFYMNNSKLCEKGISPTLFKDFEYVYTGHFHTPSTKGNITYLGSPYAQTFHDVNSVRGYYILSDNGMEFIEYKGAPKFIKISSEEIPTKEIVEGNVIKLFFEKDYGTVGNTTITDNIIKLKPFRFNVDFSKISNVKDEDEEDDENISLLSNYDIMVSYINKIKLPENIKKKTLMEIMDNMIKERE